jgi:hypothetical protein
MSRPPKPKPFPTEAALCAAFIKAVGPDWTAYNEHSGWDTLLVRKADGFQIGIQAKLKLNIDVVNQVIEGDDGWFNIAHAHPDCCAILVPEGDDGKLGKVCDCLGITVIRMRSASAEGWHESDFKHNARFTPDLPQPGKSWSQEAWHDLATVKRHKLPEYVPDVAAGAPSPLQLTDWKIKAIKLAVTLEMRKHLTRRDFAHHRVDHRRWVTQGWLKVVDGRFVKDAFPNFKKQHPKVYRQIRADAPKWLPKTLLEPVATQAALL